MAQILVVEDNDADFALLKRQLNQEYIDFIRVKSIDESELLEDPQSVDLILLDLNLQESRGLKTFLRVNESYPSTAIIVLSGLSDQGMGIEAVQLGAQDYFVKGRYDPDNLLRSIQYAIEKKKKENDLQSHISTQEMLIKETHHRVKNNFQLLISLLSLQQENSISTETKNRLQEVKERLFALSNIHETIYTSGIYHEVDLCDLIPNVLNYALASYSSERKKIRYECQIARLKFNLKDIVPFMLILNELIANSIQHAFIDSTDGKIKVVVEEEEDCIICTYNDNGMGFPEHSDSKSIGHNLMSFFAEQLSAKIEFFSNEGAFCRILLPKDKLL